MANDYQQAAAWCEYNLDATESSRLTLRAVRAFEALVNGWVVLWEPEGYRLEWFATRDDDAEQTRHYAPDPLDAITKALEADDA